MDTLVVIGTIIGAVGVIIGATQWMINAAGKKGANNQKIQDAHDKIRDYDKKSVECEKRFVQLEERKTDNRVIEEIRMDIFRMSGKVEMDIFRMSGKLDAVLLGGNVGDGIVQAHSPVSLTEFGLQLAKEMDMEARIAKNWDKIVLLMDSSIESKNPYDIQQFCMDVAGAFPERFFSDEDIDFMKIYAYGKGKPLAYYGSMIGVMIRDAYFKHKGIGVDEIDKHDPGKG